MKRRAPAPRIAALVLALQGRAAASRLARQPGRAGELGSDLGADDRPQPGRTGREQHAGLSAVVLLLTVALSVVGVVNLVATGYGLLSIAFLFTFTIPLLTIGVWRIRSYSRTAISTQL